MIFIPQPAFQLILDFCHDPIKSHTKSINQKMRNLFLYILEYHQLSNKNITPHNITLFLTRKSNSFIKKIENKKLIRKKLQF